MPATLPWGLPHSLGLSFFVAVVFVISTDVVDSFSVLFDVVFPNECDALHAGSVDASGRCGPCPVGSDRHLGVKLIAVYSVLF